MRIWLLIGLSFLLVIAPHAGHAAQKVSVVYEDQLPQLQRGAGAPEVAQKGGGKSLSEAIEQVRRQTGGRILGAETKIKGNREVHHVKVLTRDGKVKTIKVQGRRLN